MIEAKNLTKCFQGTAVLDHVNCTIQEGSIYGMVGSNGAGKSTFLRCLSGVYQIDEGEILIDRSPVWDNVSVKSKIMYIPDELFFPTGITLEGMAKMYQNLYEKFDMPYFRKMQQKIQLPNRLLSQFSKGMRRQAATILALATNPKYLLFDETFDGLDPVMRNYVKSLICEEVMNRETTAIVTSHSLRELEDVCDQLALLHKGGLVLEGDIQNLRTTQFKVQVAFDRPFDETEFQGIQISNFEKNGSVANMIVSGNRDAIVAQIQSKQPILLEVLPMSLEEVFRFEMEALGYTFQIDGIVEGGVQNVQ